jgi:hypothetical protein
MPPKRASEDEPQLGHKIQRIEHALSASPPQRMQNNDFSGSVKRKLADSKRTGQACDRCKVRSNALTAHSADVLEDCRRLRGLAVETRGFSHLCASPAPARIASYWRRAHMTAG